MSNEMIELLIKSFWETGYMVVASTVLASRQVLLDTYAQAGAFVAQFGEKMPPAYYEAARAFADMPQKHKLSRLYTLTKYRLWKGGLVRKIGQCLYS